MSIGGNVAHLLVIKIQTGDGVITLGLEGLFFNADGALLLIKRHHAIALRVVHMVGKNTGTGGAGAGVSQLLGQVMAVKNIVAQHQRTGLVGDEIAANDKGLRQPIGRRLSRGNKSWACHTPA